MERRRTKNQWKTKKKRQRLSYDVAWNCFSSFFFCFAKNNYIFIWYLWIVDDQLRTHAISDLLICCGRLAGCSIALRVLNDGEWSTWRCSFPVWCIFVVDELRKLILLTKRFERVISRWKENMLTRAFCCQMSISLFCLPSKLVCVCCSICVCVCMVCSVVFHGICHMQHLPWSVCRSHTYENKLYKTNWRATICAFVFSIVPRESSDIDTGNSFFVLCAHHHSNYEFPGARIPSRCPPHFSATGRPSETWDGHFYPTID